MNIPKSVIYVALVSSVSATSFQEMRERDEKNVMQYYNKLSAKSGLKSQFKGLIN